MIKEDTRYRPLIHYIHRGAHMRTSTSTNLENKKRRFRVYNCSHNEDALFAQAVVPPWVSPLPLPVPQVSGSD